MNSLIPARGGLKSGPAGAPGKRSLSPILPLVAGIACLAGACELRVHNESETASGSDTSSASATTDGDGAPEVCLRYVACLKEIDAEAGAEAEATHGANGSCWSGDETAAADCLALCDAQLRNYAKAFPDVAACEDEGIVSDVEFEIGQAVFDPVDPFLPPVYKSLEPGATLPVVRGGQGLLMLPFGLRGKNFVITEDPNDWDNPKMPRVDMWVDIDGHNVGFGGHFARLNNYSVGFYPLDDGMGTLEHMYIAIIVPDAIADPQTLTGQPGKVHIELNTFGEPASIQELEFVVAPQIQEY
ncbi:hypothetical protein OV203_17335 [Nannocystis sp. ILAH1]|uniref:hypothetical protein n=1 Tax=Nannocystis sp. ILAH1 TaxID=2996789 RepID=UPI00226DE69D|nr:hypothetical protein [Nannocystis sp. ILAH1]MCY0988904.1 hypothetical protein [Nannocystis sp. ILAH1]